MEYNKKFSIESMNAHMQQRGGYQRTREMTLDDMLLDNRILFMIGEINYQEFP